MTTSWLAFDFLKMPEKPTDIKYKKYVNKLTVRDSRSYSDRQGANAMTTVMNI